MDLDTEETRETHNLHIESTRGSLKNITLTYIIVQINYSILSKIVQM